MQQNTSGSRLDGVIALEERFTYRFAVIASRMGSALAPSHERYGLSVAAWRVRAVIGRYEPLSAKELARRTSTDPFRVTRALTLLDEKGFVSRQADPQDRRRVSLRLTAPGRKVHDEIAMALSAMEHSVLQALGTREQALLFRLIDKLDRRIGTCLDDGAWSARGGERASRAMATGE